MNKPVFPGKFEVQGEIAVGKTGTIYYGYDLELRQEVAIKIYHTHINGRLIRGKPFIEKAAPLLRLDHPNLIKIFKIEEDDGTPVVFMEFFDGPSLQQVIQEKGPLSVENTLILSRGIAEVLVHTHFQGIIHGTLHPGHVLVGPQQNIKVMDLGLSWILMDILSDCNEDLLRPLHYLPPESARGELLSLSSDLYSLGFMMYEMLTCTTPYTDLPKTSILGKLAFDKSDPAFNFPDSVPEGVRDFIRQLTRNDLQKRLKDATHALTIINQLLARLKPGTMPTAPLPAASRKPLHTDVSPKQKMDPQKSEPLTGAHTQETAPPPVPSRSSQSPGIPRPSTPVNYLKEGRTASKRYAGILAGIVALVLAGGSIGYWFRDSFDQFRTPPPLTFSEEKYREQPPPSEVPATQSTEPIANPSIPPLKEPAGVSSNSVNNPLPQATHRAENQPPQPSEDKKSNQEILSSEKGLSSVPTKPPTSSIGTTVPNPGHPEISPEKSSQMNQSAREAIVEGGPPQTSPGIPLSPSPAAPSPFVPQAVGISPTKSPAADQPIKKVILQEDQQPKSSTNPPIPPTEASQTQTPQPGEIPHIKSPVADPSIKTPALMDPVTEKMGNPTAGIPPVKTPQVLPPSPVGSPEAKAGVLPSVEENARPLKKADITKTGILHDPAIQELLDSVDATDSLPVLSEQPKVGTPQKP